jgi:hypothetical protein
VVCYRLRDKCPCYAESNGKRGGASNEDLEGALLDEYEIEIHLTYINALFTPTWQNHEVLKHNNESVRRLLKGHRKNILTSYSIGELQLYFQRKCCNGMLYKG